MIFIGRFPPRADRQSAHDKQRTVILCSGKLYYELDQRRRALEGRDIAIVRIEQLYPFPEERSNSLSRHDRAKSWLWVQEEPENMGAWRFVAPLLENAGISRIDYVGRRAAPSPARDIPVCTACRRLSSTRPWGKITGGIARLIDRH